MEMVQNEASLLVKAFDLKMRNVSQLIEKEAENRQTLQTTLNSIVSFVIYFRVGVCSVTNGAKLPLFFLGYLFFRRSPTESEMIMYQTKL